jgi:hypothetical protein
MIRRFKDEIDRKRNENDEVLFTFDLRELEAEHRGKF